ncbi:VOC family protein [Lutispora thermophila]|uniref:Lactoylglutathione lyase n=1 Tax=Lutispora thermophila DSM 19022 TaxID=1122184 RepID=A0A1M6H4I1_9FIRM|nr:VOC family protein [Lutispora thermophila]SHJ17104.1 lactoylglutathione lyase [Lutispora thermophila DSM 19022]
MKFCWTTLTVKNMEESLRFYQEVVGLPVHNRFQTGPGIEIAFLGDGETKLELISNENVKNFNMGRSISIGFQVDSLDNMMAFLKEKGIGIHSGPFQPNPNTKFFYVLDPNGLKVQFVESI